MGKSHSLSKQDCVDMTHGFIWYDFMSVPQCIGETKGCTETQDEQMEAILSIPAYIRKCRFFLVLCPTQLDWASSSHRFVLH